jgi:hypothetical protein
MSAQLNGRELRGRRIYERGGVQVHNPIDRTYDVKSEGDASKTYRVRLKAQACDCFDSQPLYNVAHEIVKPANKCKHIIAAELFETAIATTEAEAKPRITLDAMLAKYAPAT